MAALSAEEPLRRQRAAASRGKSEHEGNVKQGDMPPRAPLIAGFFFFRFFSCFARKMTLGPTFAAQGPALNACNEPPRQMEPPFLSAWAARRTFVLVRPERKLSGATREAPPDV